MTIARVAQGRKANRLARNKSTNFTRGASFHGFFLNVLNFHIMIWILPVNYKLKLLKRKCEHSIQHTKFPKDTSIPREVYEHLGHKQSELWAIGKQKILIRHFMNMASLCGRSLGNLVSRALYLYWGPGGLSTTSKVWCWYFGRTRRIVKCVRDKRKHFSEVNSFYLSLNCQIRIAPASGTFSTVCSILEIRSKTFSIPSACKKWQPENKMLCCVISSWGKEGTSNNKMVY